MEFKIVPQEDRHEKENIIEVMASLAGKDVDFHVKVNGEWFVLFWVNSDGQLHTIAESMLPEGFHYE